ncbi:DEAD/DEAH box helicase [Vibrio sp. RC27]
MLRTWQAECIDKALLKYSAGQKHFLAQATPGAGKTIFSAYLSKKLLDSGKIDLVICFSPSVTVSAGFAATFSHILKCSFNGKIGCVGMSLTYQSLQYLDDNFWKTLSKHRVLAIFDEIHHCSGENVQNANSWGEQLLLKVQQSSTFTLALTGTPWRSDRMPISLSSYSDPEGKIICDYQYTLQQAIMDNVCRKPKLVLVDNEQLKITNGNKSESYNSISTLFKENKLGYSSILHDTNALSHILKLACNKLKSIRSTNSNAGGLVVASSVSHAKLIQKLLTEKFNQSSVLVSYHDLYAQTTINRFKNSDVEWIISIGMVSEGTDIPRLQVCCHLSNVRTELYFRQVLGRILRITKLSNQEAWLYTFAEESLISFAEQIEQDIPESCLYIKQDTPKQDTSENTSANSLSSLSHSGSISGNQAKLHWDNKILNLGDTTNDSQHESLSLGKFRERVIQAFSAL